MGIDHSCASLQHKDAEKVEALGGVEGLAKALNVHMEDGISAEATGDLSVKRRQELYGANRFATVPAQSFWAILLDALSDKVLIVLMVAATVCSAALLPPAYVSVCICTLYVARVRPGWACALLVPSPELVCKMPSILHAFSGSAGAYHSRRPTACRYLQ